MIGIQLATTDGRLVKAGGNVVKNVAGYDLGKLVCGSFGSLAAIVTATFKLAPLPAASTTLVASFGDRRGLAQAAQAVGASQLEPSAFDLSVVSDPARPRSGGRSPPPGHRRPGPDSSSDVSAASNAGSSARPDTAC